MWDYYRYMVLSLFKSHCCHIYSILKIKTFLPLFLSIIYVQGIVGDIPGRANISSFRSLPALVNTSRDAQYNLHNY